MTTLSKSEYAASKGWSRPYVSKLAKNGRLVLTSEGLVDVEATEARIHATADPSKIGVASRHAAARSDRDVHRHTGARAPGEAGDGEEYAGYQSARARRENHLADLAEIELLKARDALLERPAVEATAMECGRATRDQVLGVPRQIANELAALTDPWEIENKLTTALRKALEAAANQPATEAGTDQTTTD
ncbi:hypothetical protein [Chitiniphilus eburneus]|uniref:hypothetical protein n=1 Tax=Chitiniphilus eburneus TaxID=2571148 RepID=UPI0035D1198D